MNILVLPPTVMHKTSVKHSSNFNYSFLESFLKFLKALKLDKMGGGGNWPNFLLYFSLLSPFLEVIFCSFVWSNFFALLMLLPGWAFASEAVELEMCPNPNPKHSKNRLFPLPYRMNLTFFYSWNCSKITKSFKKISEWSKFTLTLCLKMGLYNYFVLKSKLCHVLIMKLIDILMLKIRLNLWHD